MTRSGRVKASAGLVLGLLLLLPACAGKDPELVLRGRTMGTSWLVRAPAQGPTDDRRLRERIEAELEAVNAEASNWREDSQISRLNRAAPGEWVPVAPELAAMLRLAARVRARSGGAFDVTVEPLVRLWGFGSGAAAPSAVPAPEAIAAARARTGPGCIEVQGAGAGPPRARRLRDCVVDLSAIAKGHGVDRVFELLDAAGLEDLLVEIGGELRVRGRNASGGPWRVGIEIPEPLPERRARRVLPLGDVAVATSGDYRNFFEIDGVRYSHTIDPRTGRPVRHELASVTVLDPGGAMAADAWATALNVLGPEAGRSVAEREGIAALFVVRTPDGYAERETSALQDVLAAPPSS